MDAVYKERITKILVAAAAAPSGDNSQPWRFVFRAPDTLEFHAMPEKDNALLNIDESGTLIALGAAIENAELEAKAQGFSPEIRYAEAGTLIATFVLHEGGALPEGERHLREAIVTRHTNRKAYQKTPFREDDRAVLMRAAPDTPNAALLLVEDRDAMTTISRALTTMEEVALSNKTIHKLFFESIFWSRERNAAGVHGLFIRTLELPPPARLLFKILPYWPVARVFAFVGFPKLVALMNAEQNANASAFGVITLRTFSRTSYIEAGRLLERVWLAAAAQGMSLQIVTGMLFLARAMERSATSAFSASEREVVRKAYARVRENIESGREPFLTFRVGYGAPPSAVSCRKPPVLEEAC